MEGWRKRGRRGGVREEGLGPQRTHISSLFIVLLTFVGGKRLPFASERRKIYRGSLVGDKQTNTGSLLRDLKTFSLLAFDRHQDTFLRKILSGRARGNFILFPFVDFKV